MPGWGWILSRSGFDLAKDTGTVDDADRYRLAEAARKR
jgi:hypothetical protein